VTRLIDEQKTDEERRADRERERIRNQIMTP